MNRSLSLPRSHDTGTYDSAPRFSLKGLLDLFYTWQVRAQQRIHLGELDDRLLRDMGLSRADIEAEIAKPFWRG